MSELKNPITFLTDKDEIERKVNLLTQEIVKSMPGEEEEEAPVRKNPEERLYLIYYYADDPDNNRGEKIKSFEEIKGRTKIYEFIKNMIEYIDIHESKVLVETLTLNDAVSVYDFMKVISQYYESDTFDIEDYNFGDVGEDQIGEE